MPNAKLLALISTLSTFISSPFISLCRPRQSVSESRVLKCIGKSVGFFVILLYDRLTNRRGKMNGTTMA